MEALSVSELFCHLSSVSYKLIYYIRTCVWLLIVFPESVEFFNALTPKNFSLIGGSL